MYKIVDKKKSCKDSITMKELSNQLNICKELYKKEKFKFFNSKL